MDKTIIYFDGICYLCNSFMNFLIKIDGKRRLKFSPLQSNFAQKELNDSGIDLNKIDSIVFQKGNNYFVKSDAVNAIIKQLNWYWRILLIAKILPKNLRDRLYDFVAINRYNWFGKKDMCMIPTEEVKSRFIID